MSVKQRLAGVAASTLLIGAPLLAPTPSQAAPTPSKSRLVMPGAHAGLDA